MLQRTEFETGLFKTASRYKNVDFVIRKTDDFWVRDNGPIFVFDETYGDLAIADWGFNGWGFDAPYHRDNTVPIGIASQKGFYRFNVNDLVLEGGAIEVDGNGVLMATPEFNSGAQSQSRLDRTRSRVLFVRHVRRNQVHLA